MGGHREVFLSDHISTKKEDVELLTHKYGSAQAQRCTHMQVSICLPYKRRMVALVLGDSKIVTRRSIAMKIPR